MSLTKNSEHLPVFPAQGHTGAVCPVKKSLVIVNCTPFRKVVNNFRSQLHILYKMAVEQYLCHFNWFLKLKKLGEHKLLTCVCL